MRRYLLPQSGNFYKANMHCHTTVSDGGMTPQEVKELYQSRGYSIVAYTDHHVLVPHPELKDDDFLPLYGVELNVDEIEGADRAKGKTCHFNLIALDENNLIQPCYHREKYMGGNAESHRCEVQFDPSLPDYERSYTGECLTEMMETARKQGFFVTYNHPTWSRERYPQYMSYHGMHALEIINYSCLVGGYDDYNPRVYDDLLSDGRRIFAVAGDDNHKLKDACGGFTMIKAEELTYSAVASALKQGHFYASNGPLIHALWVEDNKIHITCSGAYEVTCYKQMPRRDKVCRAEPGGFVTEAEFPIAPGDGYVRLTVTDHSGRHAVTNAYFPDQLFD